MRPAAQEGADEKGDHPDVGQEPLANERHICPTEADDTVHRDGDENNKYEYDSGNMNR